MKGHETCLDGNHTGTPVRVAGCSKAHRGVEEMDSSPTARMNAPPFNPFTEQVRGFS